MTIKWLLGRNCHFGSVNHIIGHILIQDIENFNHGHCKGVGFLFAAEVESINLSIIPPLVECRSGLIVLQALEDSAVDHNLDYQRVVMSATHDKY